jgi:hypothetical protein
MKSQYDTQLATLEVNLKDLLEGAFKRYQRQKGQQAKFNLVMVFEIVNYLRFMHGDRD